MNDLQLGKMYLVKKYFWLLFPIKEAAGEWRVGVSVAGARMAYENAKWYSERLSCNIAVVEKSTCFVLLEQDEVCFKLLDSNGNIGWIGCRDFSNYFELVKE